MPYARPDFDGASLNVRLFLKLEAPSRLGPWASYPLSAALFKSCSRARFKKMSQIYNTACMHTVSCHRYKRTILFTLAKVCP